MHGFVCPCAVQGLTKVTGEGVVSTITHTRHRQHTHTQYSEINLGTFDL